MVRLISGIVMAGAALAAMVWLPQAAFRVAVSLLAAAAAFEFAPLAGRRQGIGRALVVLVAALAAWVLSEQPFNMPAVSMVALLVIAGRVLGQGRQLPSTLAALVGVLYIGVPFALVAHLRGQAGWRVTVFLVATVVVSDSLQYYTGRLWGRRPLAPTVSPKKTIEGALGGLTAVAAFLTLVGPVVLTGHSRLALAALGLVLASLGICGDLFESKLKRDAGLKDSSHLIPGHGGVLDRVDALLFATPAYYLFVRGLM